MCGWTLLRLDSTEIVVCDEWGGIWRNTSSTASSIVKAQGFSHFTAGKDRYHISSTNITRPVYLGCCVGRLFGQGAGRRRVCENGVQRADMDIVLEWHDRQVELLNYVKLVGKPKAIVHRQGGMLIDSLREHHLAGDMSRGDVYMYYTTP